MSELRYSTNHDGQRVIPASQRADGSIRPERRVREGYVPQDEQPLYQSRAALVRRGVPTCPGANFVETEEKKTATQSKSSKKNEKRKQKKKETTESVTDKIEQLSLDPDLKEDTSQLSADERHLKTLRKKIRQCTILEQRRDAGETLTEPENIKLSKVSEWRETVSLLENR